MANRWGAAAARREDSDDEDDDGTAFERNQFGQTIVREADGTSHRLMYSSRAAGFDFSDPNGGRNKGSDDDNMPTRSTRETSSL
jgi:hypothetical protein